MQPADGLWCVLWRVLLLLQVTEAQQQWWGFKADNFDSVLLFKVGKFYEVRALAPQPMICMVESAALSRPPSMCEAALQSHTPCNLPLSPWHWTHVTWGCCA
jgi:hypothetical protein